MGMSLLLPSVPDRVMFADSSLISFCTVQVMSKYSLGRLGCTLDDAAPNSPDCN